MTSRAAGFSRLTLLIRTSGHTIGGIALVGGIALITLVPVAYVLIASFDVADVAAPYQFGLEGWREVLSSSNTIESIVNSFILAVRVPFALAIGFVISWFLVRADVPGGRFIEISLWFGFFLPTVPMLMGWILLLDKNYGLINRALQTLPFIDGPIFSIYSIPAIIFVHLALSTVPIMVILLAPALRQIDSSYEEAAEMSGAGTPTTLSKVTIPLLLPAILTAFLASFIRSLETFEVEALLGTPINVFVYATRIYSLINWEPALFPQAMALSTLFLFILLGMALFYQRYLSRRGDRATLTGRGVSMRSRRRSWWVYLAASLIILYVLLTIFLPLTILVLGSVTRVFGYFFIENTWTSEHWSGVLRDSAFLRATVSSVILGVVVGILGVLIFSLIAWVLVRTKLWGRSIASVLIWLPWAIPGIILGVTMLSLLLNAPVISLVYGTVIPLVAVLIIKELPIGVQMLRTSLGQVSGELEEAAVMAGAGFRTIFFSITLPLISPMLVSVFLLTFAVSIRDISTLVLIAGPDWQTLSLLMFDFASNGRFEAAAVVGVILASLSLAVTTIAMKFGLRAGIRR